MRGFNYKKAVQALNYFAQMNGGTLNKMKAIKLIWLSDRLHLRKYGRTITGDIYFALPHGPVPSVTKDILSLNSFTLSEDEFKYIDEYLSVVEKYDYSSNKSPYLKVFSKTDVSSIEEIFRYYGKYDHFALRDISHKFPEWKVWENKLGKTNSRFLMNYSDFFKDAEISSPVFDADPEDLALVEALFFRNEIGCLDAK
jgi:uncharacterized phage-associated protein